MRPAILSAGAVQIDGAGFEVDFRPAQAADFVPPLAGQHQQSDDPAVVVIGRCLPHRSEFAIIKHAFARLFLGGLVGADYRVRLAQPLPDGPSEHGRQRPARAVGGNRTQSLAMVRICAAMS